jgi:hypothetical protein
MACQFLWDIFSWLLLVRLLTYCCWMATARHAAPVLTLISVSGSEDSRQ